MSWLKQIVEKLRGNKLPKGIEVETRKTAWERVLHGRELDETRWEQFKRWWRGDKEKA